MNTNETQVQTQMTEDQPKLTAEQAWALRMADGRHRELTARIEEVAVGTAKVAVALEGVDTKCNAILEAVHPAEPQGWLDGAVHKVNKALDKAWFYAKPLTALVAMGFAGAKGVQGVQGWRRRRAEAQAAAALPPAATHSAS